MLTPCLLGLETERAHSHLCVLVITCSQWWWRHSALRRSCTS